VITDPAVFVADHFPEFAKAKPSRIQAALDDAAANTSEAVFGTSAERAQVLLAAHTLASGPSGREAKFTVIDSTTVYLSERRRLEDLVAPGYGVTP
jgi:predicted kinase